MEHLLNQWGFEKYLDKFIGKYLTKFYVPTYLLRSYQFYKKLNKILCFRDDLLESIHVYESLMVI